MIAEAFTSLTGTGIARNQAAIQSRHKNALLTAYPRNRPACAPERDATGRHDVNVLVPVDCRIVAPYFFPGRRIQGEYLVERGVKEKHVVPEDGCRLKVRPYITERIGYILEGTGMKCPGNLQAVHIGCVNLVVNRVPLSTGVATVGRPVLVGDGWRLCERTSCIESKKEDEQAVSHFPKNITLNPKIDGCKNSASATTMSLHFPMQKLEKMR